MRPTWDQYFLPIAFLVATRSTCRTRSVGCVVVDRDNHIVATGYNGAPSGTSHCGDECEGRISGQRYDLCRAVHAETNAVVSAAKHGAKLDGSTFYLTCAPCILCARVIVAAGAERVCCLDDYPNDGVEELFNEAGITMTVMGKGNL